MKNPLAASGSDLFSAEFAYRNAPRHLVGWTAKSKPIRVGDANHGNSEFRLFPVHNKFFRQTRPPLNPMRTLEKQHRNAIARESRCPVRAACSHRRSAVRRAPNLSLENFRQFFQVCRLK